MEELMHFPPRSEVRALLAKFDRSSFDSERDAYDLTMAPNEHGFCLDSLPGWTGTKAEPTRTASRRSNTALCQLFIAHARHDHFRSALTFGGIALDRYVHERVDKGIVAALKRPVCSVL